jgi:hypothetical protein
MEDAHCKPNPWVSLRHDQLIPVNKAVNKKEQLEKRAGGGGEKKHIMLSVCEGYFNNHPTPRRDSI